MGRPGLPWTSHGAAIAVLALAAALRFSHLASFEPPKTDERIYLQAFRAVSLGESPYTNAPDGLDFYYPPPFATLGAAALERTDTATVVLALRITNLLGLATTLWCSALFAPWARRWCLPAALGYLLLAPPALVHGLGSGNISFAVIGAALVALVAWRRHPWLASLLLGLGSVVKPIAPVGLAALAAHRPSGGSRRHWIVACTGLALAAALTLASPFLEQYLAIENEIDEWPLVRSVSFYRWLHLAGLPISALGTVLLVTLLTISWARRAPIDGRQLFVLSIVGMTLATPALWSHTLLLTLPLQVMSLGRAWTRRRSRVRARSPLERYELALVLLAASALQWVDGIGGGVETSAAPLQLLVLCVPVWAPLALGAYVWRSADGDDPSRASGAA